MDIKTRQKYLQQKFPENRIDAFLVSHLHNMYYLSGCEGLEGYILVTGNQSIIATDFRYTEQAERQSPGCGIFRISGKMADWLPNWWRAEHHIRYLGFEATISPLVLINRSPASEVYSPRDDRPRPGRRTV